MTSPRLSGTQEFRWNYLEKKKALLQSIRHIIGDLIFGRIVVD